MLNRKYITIMLGIVLIGAGVFNRNYKQPQREETAKILGEAAYVNNNVKVEEGITVDDEDLNREKASDEAKEMLESIIENPATTEDGRKQAEQEMIYMAKSIKYEADCEMLLKNKGFADSVVTITDNSASVYVDVKDIMGTEIAQIVDTVTSVTGIASDKIKISSGHWYS